MAKTQTTSDNTVIRAVTLPVVGPVDESWENVNEALKVAFRFSTDLANWCVHYLFRLDAPGVAECPDAVTKAYPYGAAVKKFPDWGTRAAGIAASAQCVLRGVQWKYMRDRFAIQMRHESSLLTYRYPFPFPLHNANWSVAFARGPWPGEAPVVTLAVPVLGRVALRLERGPEFGRQLAMLRQLIDGRRLLEAEIAKIPEALPKQRKKELREAAARKVIATGCALPGEAAVYRNGKGKLLVKFVGRFPRKDRGPATNVAFVHTDPNALLVVEINGRRANVTNADHVRREVAKHRSRSSNDNRHADVEDAVRSRVARHALFRQRVAEDRKREKRMDRGQRAGLNKYVEDRCRKQNARLDTIVEQIAAQVARMCARQGVGTVCYDDSNREFMRRGGDDLPFPWHALKTRLQQLLGANPPGESPTGEMGCGWVDGQFAHIPTYEGRTEWLGSRSSQAMLTAARRVRAHLSRPPGKSHPAVSKPPGTSSNSGRRSSTTCSRATRRPGNSPDPSAGPEA